jgi:hypothetical protein
VLAAAKKAGRSARYIKAESTRRTPPRRPISQ